MSTNSKKNIFKILFFIVLFAFIGLSLVYISSQDKNTNPSSQYNALQKELYNATSKNQTLIAVLEADNLLITKSNPKEALQKYQSVIETTEGNLRSLILSRIDYTKQVIESNTDDEISRINLRTQLANLQDEIDSLSSYTDSLSRNRIAEKTIVNKKIDSLEQKNTKLTKELNRKEAKQVISFTNKNGNLIHYLGEVENGKANGGGIGIWNTGSIYKGEWKNNQRHGKGEFKWADGQVYNGEFKNDTRSGTGTYYWPSGEKYEGEFANNRMNGEGILFDPDGNKKYEGQWKNDKPKQ